MSQLVQQTAHGQRSGPHDRRGLPLGLAVTGLFLGWQAILAMGLGIVAIHAAIETLNPWPWWRSLSRTSPGIWLCLGTTAWILVWRTLVEQWPILGSLVGIM